MTDSTISKALPRLLTVLLLGGVLSTLHAGVPFRARIIDDRVGCLEVTVPEAEEHRSLPYYLPSRGESITFSFDLLEDAPRSLRYRLFYYDADWRPSPLVSSETQSGFLSGVVPYPEPSVATKVHYWHYSLNLNSLSDPAPKLSGNWRIFFFEEGYESMPLLEVSFGVVDPIFEVEADGSANTQKGVYGRYQELSATVRANTPTTSYLERGVKLLVAQNGRSDNAQLLEKPSFVGLDYLEFKQEVAALFEGGNEYLSFEILGATESNMGVERLALEGTVPYAVLYPSENGSSKVYQSLADADGRRVVRAPYGSTGGATEADYYYVEFTFYSPLLEQSIFLCGEAFDVLPLDERKLHYDAQLGAYKTVLLLKAGYYSYQYLAGSPLGDLPLQSEMTVGSHYQTSNSYTVIVYYRDMEQRNDTIVAVQELQTR